MIKNNQESAIFLPELTREITLISPHFRVHLLDPRLCLLLVTDNANTVAWIYERRWLNHLKQMVYMLICNRFSRIFAGASLKNPPSHIASRTVKLTSI